MHSQKQSDHWTVDVTAQVVPCCLRVKVPENQNTENFKEKLLDQRGGGLGAK